MTTFINVPLKQLRVGMYVQLDQKWMDHPFPKGSFRVASDAQIAALREMGLTEVRVSPAKSDRQFHALKSGDFQLPARIADRPHEGLRGPGSYDASAPLATDVASRHVELLRVQQAALAACDQQFIAASRVCMRLQLGAEKAPLETRTQGEALVSQCVRELLGGGDAVIRLLSEGVGERSTLHPVNVMVLSLLLGKAQGADAQTLEEIGLAALLHDVGKIHLPPYLWTRSQDMTAADVLRYEKHVSASVAIGQRMGLSENVLQAIAQHHEMADGRGFPRGLMGDALGNGGRIIALVNHYDRLCNPAQGAMALTPHEALSVIFAQHKSRFDAEVLNSFIRMMGVYPPGSIVQLVNGQYAMVVSVNSSRPLRPRVIVHDANVPRDEALVLDLEREPTLGIRSSLKPAQLPRAALDYLSPRTRICYFFERAVLPTVEKDAR